MLTRAQEDPEIARQFAALLPRLSFELSSLEYDGDRKLNSVQRIVFKDPASTNDVQYQYNAVPYNLLMKLYVYAKNVDDGNQIMEQILPFFTPDWTANIQLIPGLEEFKTPIILDSIELNDLYDGKFEERRVLVWTLNFKVKGLIFGPIYKSPIIKFAITNVRVDGSSSNTSTANSVAANTVGLDQTITLTPGLTANGQPTSNAALSVNVMTIAIDSNWGFVTNAVSFIS